MDILVVEDDAALRTMMVEVLTDAGCTVTAVPSAEDAWPALLRQVPDVVLVDQRLPGMPGTTFSRIVQADPQTQHVPLVLMSASRPLELGTPGTPTAFLPKPFTIAALLTALHQAA